MEHRRESLFGRRSLNVLRAPMDDLYNQPIDVVVNEGAVVLFGPGPLCGAFTPEAAERTAQELLKAADRARTWAEQSVVALPYA